MKKVDSQNNALIFNFVQKMYYGYSMWKVYI